MTLDPAELLARLSDTLRHDIGPAVDDEYTKTQAFMASVIVGKLSRAVALAPEHRAAERIDLDRLHLALAGPLAAAPAEVTEARSAAIRDGTVAALGPLVDAVYRWGLDVAEASEAMELIRDVLRRDIDRRMEIAR